MCGPNWYDQKQGVIGRLKMSGVGLSFDSVFFGHSKKMNTAIGRNSKQKLLIKPRREKTNQSFKRYRKCPLGKIPVITNIKKSVYLAIDGLFIKLKILTH